MFKIKILNILLFLISFSTMIPILISIFGNYLFHLPILILILVTLIILTVKNYKFNIECDFLFATFLVTIIIIILNFFSSRGFAILAMGGYVIICSFIFQNIYFLDKKISIKTLLNFFNFFYKGFLIIMLIEFILILNGYQPILDKLIGYKTTNSFDILRFFSVKFYDLGGLNSIFLGSQIAGTMSLLSYIWFHLTEKINYFYNYKNFIFWKIFSLFFVVITINFTNFLLMIIFIIFYINKNLKNSFFAYLISFVFFFSILYLINNQFIFSRVFNFNIVNIQPKDVELYKKLNIWETVSVLNTFQYYVFFFLRPVYLWNDSSLFEKLFGLGNYYSDSNIFIGGDFAYGFMLFSNGFLFTFFFTVIIFKIAYNYFYLNFINQFENNIFQYFALVVILLFFSLIHYGQAIANPGIILFFAFHISIANAMIKNKIIFKNIKIL
jgi:hypothetical protein